MASKQKEYQVDQYFCNQKYCAKNESGPHLKPNKTDPATLLNSMFSKPSQAGDQAYFNTVQHMQQ